MTVFIAKEDVSNFNVEYLKEGGIEVTLPDPILEIDMLVRAKSVLKLANITELAKLPKQQLHRRVNSNKSLTVEHSKKISEMLTTVGIYLFRPKKIEVKTTKKIITTI